MVKLTEDMVVARSKGADLHNIKKLNCWGSDLTDVAVVRKLPNVEVLSLSVNKISSLQDFQYCNNLQELYIRKNVIKDINDLLYLQHLPKLKNLWLSDNPCAEFTQYRMTVLRALPHLQKLDNVPVKPEEVQQSMASGRQLPLSGTYFKGDAAVQSSANSQEPVYSPTASEGSPPTRRQSQSNGYTHSPEVEYSYSTKVYEDDDEAPIARPQSYTTQEEAPQQASPLKEQPEKCDKPLSLPLGFLRPKPLGQSRLGYYENRHSYADYEDDKHSVASSQYYSQRRQSYSGSTPKLHQYRQSPQRSIADPETGTSPDVRSYARQSDSAVTYREDSLPPRSDSAQPNTTNSSPFSTDSNENNWVKSPSPPRPSSYREQTWANENGYHNRSESSKSEINYNQRKDTNSCERISNEYRSPTKETQTYNRYSHVFDDGHGYESNYTRRESSECYTPSHKTSMQSPTVARPYNSRPKSRNANVLSAVLCLIKELDFHGLEVAETAIRCRMDEMED